MFKSGGRASQRLPGGHSVDRGALDLDTELVELSQYSGDGGGIRGLVTRFGIDKVRVVPLEDSMTQYLPGWWVSAHEASRVTTRNQTTKTNAPEARTARTDCRG